MSSAEHPRLNRERGSNPRRTLSHSPQSKVPRNTRFHDGGSHALSVIINDQAKTAGSIMNVDVNDSISMLECITQGFSSNLNDLFANASPHWEFRSMSVVVNSLPPLFRKRSRRHGKRLAYILRRKRRST
jgi:hypothetical protein